MSTGRKLKLTLSERENFVAHLQEPLVHFFLHRVEVGQFGGVGWPSFTCNEWASVGDNKVGYKGGLLGIDCSPPLPWVGVPSLFQ